MDVFGVRRGSDAGAAVVGLGETGAGRGDSSGAQGVEGGRGEGRDMGPCGFLQGEDGGRGGLRRVYQPPYSPELNPAERVFEEVRRWVEGRRYERIEAKKAAVEEVLR